MEQEKEYKHPRLPISAPAAYWSALGYKIYDNSDAPSEDSWVKSSLDSLLIVGLSKTDGDPLKTIAWAIEEKNRLASESARIRATEQESKALNNLASAMRSAAEEEVLRTILPRLTERTQYAVRAQLRS